MKTRKMLETEKQLGVKLEILIPRLYLTEQRDDEVAHTLGITRTTLDIWCMRLGLRRRRITVAS